MLRNRTVLPALALCAVSLSALATASPAAAAAPTGQPPTGQPLAAARADRTPDYLIGVSVPAPVLGDVPVTRVFANHLPLIAPQHKVVISFRDWDELSIRLFVRTAVPGTVIAYAHEPEQEIARRQYSADTWADRTVELTQIIRDEGRVGEVRPATVLMRWTLDPQSHRQAMLATMLSARVVGALQSADGILGWDSYAGPRSNRTPEDMYGVAADYSTSRGLPWAVMETGSKRVDPDRWRDTFAYLDDMRVPPTYFMAWNPSHRNGGVYAIQDQPTVAAVWRAAIASHDG